MRGCFSGIKKRFLVLAVLMANSAYYEQSDLCLHYLQKFQSKYLMYNQSFCHLAIENNRKALSKCTQIVCMEKLW